MTVANLHSLAMREVPLCVQCRQCGRRQVLGSDKLPIHTGNMTRIRDIKLRCQCGSDDAERIVPHDLENARLFLSGQEIEPALPV